LRRNDQAFNDNLIQVYCFPFTISAKAYRTAVCSVSTHFLLFIYSVLQNDFSFHSNQFCVSSQQLIRRKRRFIPNSLCAYWV